MKILTIADKEADALYEYFDKSRLADIDLILSCGDLSPEYLEFLVTMGHAPVIYVPGNHDDKYVTKPPQGCTCADGKVVQYKGLRVAGLGGAMRYKPEGVYLYTEEEQRHRVQKLKRQIARYGGVDIFISHAPARGMGDGEDLPHIGYSCYYEILDLYHPRFFVHGHEHLNYGGRGVREQAYQETKVINAYERYVIELKETEYPAEGEHSGSLLFDLYHRFMRNRTDH